MMKKTLIAGSLLALIVGCGGSGGGGAGSPVGPGGVVPNGPGGGDDAEGSEGYYRDGIYSLNGEPIPLTKIPSILTDGKLVDTCKPGQSMHLDECFDEIHLSEEPGFRLTKPGKEVIERGPLSDGWIESFAEKDIISNNEISLTHRRTYICDVSCPSTTVYGDYGIGGQNLIVRPKGDGFHFGNNTTFFTFFAFGGRPGMPEHIWLLNGTITLKGKTLKLPVTRRQIKEMYPEIVFDRVETKYGEIDFYWETDIIGFKNVPINDDDKRLIGINHITINDEEILLAEETRDVQPNPN